MGISASKHLSSVNNEYRQTAVFFLRYPRSATIFFRFSLLASRFTYGAAGFLILSLWSGGERYPTPFLH
jgi:hypothetical protein